MMAVSAQKTKIHVAIATWEWGTYFDPKLKTTGIKLNISTTLPKNIGTVIVKHANPCGVSVNKVKINSYKEALKCDPVSAFGGIVSCNFRITKKIALELKKMFLEVIIGNGFDNDSLKILKKKKNLRLCDTNGWRWRR